MFMKVNSWRSFMQHLLLFVFIEVVFVLLIFREFPQTNLLTIIGVLHTSYWLIVLLAGWLREKYAYRVWQKFLCTYVPVVYHVIIHIIAGLVTIEEMSDHIGEEHHDEHSMLWLVLGAIGAGILIALGEYRLHRTRHCDTHHSTAHKHCHDDACENDHL